MVFSVGFRPLNGAKCFTRNPLAGFFLLSKINVSYLSRFRCRIWIFWGSFLVGQKRFLPSRGPIFVYIFHSTNWTTRRRSVVQYCVKKKFNFGDVAALSLCRQQGFNSHGQKTAWKTAWESAWNQSKNTTTHKILGIQTLSRSLLHLWTNFISPWQHVNLQPLSHVFVYSRARL